jgi:hypothetical protein
MGLRAGIGVRPAGALAQFDRARFALSAGTVEPGIASGVNYHPSARVPRTPWREPTASEYRLLCGPELRARPWRHDADVAVFRASESAIAALRSVCEDCGYYAGRTKLEARGHPGWDSALSGFIQSLREYRVASRAIDSAALYRAEAGRATVTQVDRDAPDRARSLGLHVDSWEGTALRQRASVRNRLCVNLGREPRYFVFINLGLAQLLRAVGWNAARDSEVVTLFSGHAFMCRFPDYPVIRLRLEPNEAYVAPTGNMIHDGAAPGGDQPDVALHLLGFFAPPAGVGHADLGMQQRTQHVDP